MKRIYICWSALVSFVVFSLNLDVKAQELQDQQKLFTQFSERKMNTIIYTPTNKVENSIDFYTKLNYKIVSKGNPLIVSDGKAIIEINPARTARAGIKMYKNSWAKEIEQLRKVTAVTRDESQKEEVYFLSDLSGMWIYLMGGESPVTYQPLEESFGTLGNFTGLSLETTDMKRSIQIMEILGYKHVSGKVEHGYITYKNEDDFKITLLNPPCPHMFFNPSMTYFNGKNNPAVIEKVRAAQIPITEEITVFNKEGIVDNIIIRDPGGYGFFIFND